MAAPKFSKTLSGVMYFNAFDAVPVQMFALSRFPSQRFFVTSLAALLSQFVGETNLNARQVIEWKISKMLEDYVIACGLLAG